MFDFFKSLFAQQSDDAVKYEEKRSYEEERFNDMRIKYGENIDCIYEYDKSIYNIIALNSVPKYAVKWLADSIRQGRTIERGAIYNSIEKGLPYLCETEEELWLFESDENPLLNSVDGIYSLLLRYKYRQKDDDKFNYWLNRLVESANNDDFVAQALLCWRCGYIGSDGNYDGVVPQSQWLEYKKCYEAYIIQSCNNGEPYAQLVVAKYYNKIDNALKESLYKAAISKRLTDACYYYAKFLNSKRYEANGFSINEPPYGTAEWQEYMKDELSLYKKGAEFDNGTMAGYCQWRLADMYECGDGGVYKDEAMAQKWYKKSYENGCERAKHSITD